MTDPVDVDTNHERLWDWRDSQIVRCWQRGFSPQNFALFSREALTSIGGYDVELPAFEDWDLHVRLALAGTSTAGNRPACARRDESAMCPSSSDRAASLTGSRSSPSWITVAMTVIEPSRSAPATSSRRAISAKTLGGYPPRPALSPAATPISRNAAAKRARLSRIRRTCNPRSRNAAACATATRAARTRSCAPRSLVAQTIVVRPSRRSIHNCA